MNRPLIVDIKRNALDDGPGIRTTIFFKGCPLSCVWCQNPETLKTGTEIMFSPGDCINCKTCENLCPHRAIDLKRPSLPVDKTLCECCCTCTDNCPGAGMRKIGDYYPREKLSEIIIKDYPFFKNSGGGVTLSGGEPTMFPRYMEHFLQSLKSRNIHVNIETCGYYNRNVFEKYIFPYLDLIYFDIKFIDSQHHLHYTGRDNTIILDNFIALLNQDKVTVLPRIPLVPDITATSENLQAISRFLRENGIKKAALLPYNPLWITKADNLGKTLSYRHDKWLTQKDRDECKKHFADFTLINF